MSENFESELDPTVDPTENTERPVVDVSKLPSLPAAGSSAWRGSRRNGGRWRSMGCGCALVILAAAIFVAYKGLRDQVWSSYAEVQQGLRESILTEVQPETRQILLDGLERFDADISTRDDPYPAIGRFVATGRTVLADLVVDAEEANQLNQFLEREWSDSVGKGSGR